MSKSKLSSYNMLHILISVSRARLVYQIREKISNLNPSFPPMSFSFRSNIIADGGIQRIRTNWKLDGWRHDHGHGETVSTSGVVDDSLAAN